MICIKNTPSLGETAADARSTFLEIYFLWDLGVNFPRNRAKLEILKQRQPSGKVSTCIVFSVSTRGGPDSSYVGIVLQKGQLLTGIYTKYSTVLHYQKYYLSI